MPKFSSQPNYPQYVEPQFTSAGKAKAETNSSAFYVWQQYMCCNTVIFLEAMLVFSNSHSSL